ncbi:hypothetical protein FGIG_00086 [Fasciola gigantica]|uniref:Uncharacterized protein n=1 Tax=Fasciola gigantica TaxID=46835 RepID=A0A504YXN2_FASGI|nr:hypothetical protein FGIG_00086 [Fasciola gigantica]
MSPVGRCPYPLIRYENDETFSGKKTNDVCVASTMNSYKHLETWERLNLRHTLSSMRHKSEYFDPMVPKDGLDFKLKADYDQHRDWWKSSAQIVVQRETVNKTNRLFKNRPVKHEEPPTRPEQPFTIWISDRRDHLFHSIEALEGNHSQATNGGYSRKPDGNKFTS